MKEDFFHVSHMHIFSPGNYLSKKKKKEFFF